MKGRKKEIERSIIWGDGVEEIRNMVMSEPSSSSPCFPALASHKNKSKDARHSGFERSRVVNVCL